MKLTRFFLSAALVAVLVLPSCTVQKRLYRPGYSVEWKHAGRSDGRVPAIEEIRDADAAALPREKERAITAYAEARSIVQMEEKQLAGAVFPVEKCDTIFLHDGTVIPAKVMEIGVDELKYKKCGFESGPTYAMRKTDVQKVRYPNGVEDQVSEKSALPVAAPAQQAAPVQAAPVKQAAPEHKRMEGFGIAGFILGLIGLFIFPLPMGILAFIFGAISLGRISTHPKTLGGRGFAIIAMLLGIIILIAFVLLV